MHAHSLLSPIKSKNPMLRRAWGFGASVNKNISRHKIHVVTPRTWHVQHGAQSGLRLMHHRDIVQ